MAYVTIYGVAPYRRQGRALERGPVRSFARRDLALLEAMQLSPRAAGVLVFRIEVDGEAGLVGEPQPVARFGDAPLIGDPQARAA